MRGFLFLIVIRHNPALLTHKDGAAYLNVYHSM